MKESWVSNDIGSVGCTLLAEDRHATNARAPNAGVPLNERYIKLLFHSQGLFCISMATFKCSSMCILLHSIDSLTASVECAVLPDQFPRRPECWATQICTVNALGFDIPSSRIYSAVPAPLISESWCHFVFLTFCLVWVRLVRDLLTSRHQQIPHRKSFHQTLSQHGSIFCLSAYVSICQHAMSQCLGFEC